ncbi:D-alanyl-lipoteichoic acid acyltransferase DltB (MBOAT superfamily) [Silvibacterium bohemicum]|uniref:D-alanyl-lipoteichoic acid acyltransferase DltB (MBOAT superfamily) n=1 Tax=Silvibacterium bohemicum TaxID=1577686 RepID=A0A841JUX1_9BACT|nr:MBOAT family O-acyltransferase [Silvibacterium bohemicum]MBB6145182.1 D-alanyl-lipoteichoic acid acyltransferase DltB (MBOAT superfamily) [Silvibacterium bohemicum]
MLSRNAPLATLLFTFAAYPIAAWLVLRFVRGGLKTWLFALLNVVGAYVACLAALIDNRTAMKPLLLKTVGAAFLVYFLLVLVNYWLLKRTKNGTETWGTVALWFPIAILIVIKYVPILDSSFAPALHAVLLNHVAALFLGLSYLTFRLCHLVQEVRNDLVEMPTLSEYLSFAFFVPTLSIGPISPYSRYIASYRDPIQDPAVKRRALLRVLVGLTKYLFLSSLLSQYTYSGLLLDGHPHHRIDLLVALFGYTLYLYCNFSGFCDMVVGMSGLLGIDVMENFNVPFSARNLQEFWNRWHISLSTWLRDMMFTPMVKMLVRIFGPKSANNAIAFSICAVFVVIGVWHGVGINFALFGLFHGIGLASVHYYGIFIKKRLGKQGFLAYRENRVIGAVGTALTFTYFSLSLFLFANSWENMHQIFKVLV